MTDKLAILSNIERRLASIETVDEAKAIRDQAEAVRVYAKSAKKGLAVQNRAAMVKILAEQRAGKLTAQIERSKGGRGKTHHTLRRVLKDSGITPQTAHRWQTMATVPEAKVRQREVEATEKGEELTSAEILRSARKAIADSAPPLPLPAGVYDAFRRCPAQPTLGSALEVADRNIETTTSAQGN